MGPARSSPALSVGKPAGEGDDAAIRTCSFATTAMATDRGVAVVDQIETLIAYGELHDPLHV
jgi:hypothetical protein